MKVTRNFTKFSLPDLFTRKIRKLFSYFTSRLSESRRWSKIELFETTLIIKFSFGMLWENLRCFLCKDSRGGLSVEKSFSTFRRIRSKNVTSKNISCSSIFSFTENLYRKIHMRKSSSRSVGVFESRLTFQKKERKRDEWMKPRDVNTRWLKRIVRNLNYDCTVWQSSNNNLLVVAEHKAHLNLCSLITA